MALRHKPAASDQEGNLLSMLLLDARAPYP